MPAIGSALNTVRVDFGPNVNNDVDPKLIDALRQVVESGAPSQYLITSIFVSSADDSHAWPSRHVQKKAVDISRINGKHIKGSYGIDPATTAIVQRIQEAFEKVPGRRENYGPYLKKKSGQPYKVPGHDDHIHLSID
jgi:hypothetical protein